MSDVEVKLKAVAKEFTSSVEAAIKPVEQLLKKLLELSEASEKAAQSERRAAAASREAARDRKLAAEQKNSDKELANAKTALIASQLVIEENARRESVEKEKQAALEKAGAARALAQVRTALIASTLITEQQAQADSVEKDRKAREEQKRIAREVLQFGQSMLAQADTMKKAFLENQTAQERKAKDDKKRLDKEELEFGRSMLAQADVMKRQFLQNQRNLEKQQQDEQRTAQKKLVQEQIALQKQQIETTKEQANRIAVLTNAYQVLLRVAVKAFQEIKKAASSTVDNIDQFQRGTITTAIAITNLADPTLAFGRTWEQIFQRNLQFTRGIFVELERVAAQYFASATDLQLAYNTLAQRGVVIRREELAQLGQLTDTILLLTGGQQSSIQIQEEIRSLINGSTRVTAQLANVVKAYGLNVKQIGAEIRATQSLKPLEPILVGAKAANKEIQGTYQAAVNGLEVAFKQVQRIAGQGFFNSLVESIQRLTGFINHNREAFVRFGAVLGRLTSLGIDKLLTFFEKFTTAGGSKEALQPFIRVLAVLSAALSSILDTVQLLSTVLVQLPGHIERVTQALTGQEKQVDSSQQKLSSFGETVKSSPLNSIIASLSGGLIGVGKAATFAVDKLSGPFSQLFSVVSPEKAERLSKALTEVGDGLKSALSGVDSRSFDQRTKDTFESLTKSADEALKGLNLLSDTKATAQATAPPFRESEESIRLTKQLSSELEAVTVRADRAGVALAAVFQRAIADTQLQGLRRNLALIEQGLELGGDGTIQGINSVEAALSNFTGKTARNVALGYSEMIGAQEAFKQNTEVLEKTVSQIEQRIQTGVFQNLARQGDVAASGFRNFIDEVLSAAKELREDTSKVSRLQADKILAEAEAQFKETKDATELAIRVAEERIDILQRGGTKEGRAGLLTSSKETDRAIQDLERQRDKILDSLRLIGEQALKANKPISEFLRGTENAKLQTDLEEVNKQLTVQQRLSRTSKESLEATAKARIDLLKAAQTNLEIVRQQEFTQTRDALRLLEISQNQAKIQNQIADAQDRKITNDTTLRLEEEKRRVMSEQLRIVQQITEKRGREVLSLETEGEGFKAQQQTSLAAGLPRTDLQAALAPVFAEYQKFISFVAQRQGALEALRGSEQELLGAQLLAQESRKRLVESLKGSEQELLGAQIVAEAQKRTLSAETIASAGAEQESLKLQIAVLDGVVSRRNLELVELNKLIPAQQARIDELKKEADEILAARVAQEEMRNTLAAVGNATKSTLNTFVDSVLGAFEGKRTNFVQAFKGIADNLVKDSLKNTFNSIENTMKGAFDGIFKSIAKGLPDGMASQLGGAFMAGFGLIASFVLGQLMGDQGGSSTAGNPTVGIQSSEQVRGLIGGETQIPIGQIGESLQDALVPTNSILVRIARAVEAQTGGLSNGQIEDVINRAVGEALQIQPA